MISQSIQMQIQAMVKNKKSVVSFIGLGALLSLLSACTDSSGDKSSAKSKVPWVMELHVVPSRVTINPDKFYAKPFTVRAKYSNAIVKNISKTVQWVSEDTSLLAINDKGELVVTGQCEKAKCPVFLVATDPASGKSARVTVHLKQSMKQKLEQKTERQDKPQKSTALAEFKKKAPLLFQTLSPNRLWTQSLNRA